MSCFMAIVLLCGAYMSCFMAIVFLWSIHVLFYGY
jgi:hypothetical protein